MQELGVTGTSIPLGGGGRTAPLNYGVKKVMKSVGLADAVELNAWR